MRAVIFANGILNYLPDTYAIMRSDDLVIAADGGARHCLSLNIIPSFVIGDLDSLCNDDLNILQIAGAKIIRYPIKKDQTDLELALQLAIDMGADDIIVFGALGARWDMSIGNILLLTASKLIDATVRLIDGLQEVMLLRGGKKLVFHGQKGDILSLVPLGRDAYGVTLHGLEYPLKDDVLQSGATRGISNVLIAEKATVCLKQGLLLCIHTTKHTKKSTGCKT